ncbi:related to campothecin resistance conferring protein [Cephalotrichum gorgonifer]|uniref:Related to campothecin resistance conferring protein n=1 Tax=Cephalotrichum gorgonifer TaxID=2041049 RepID=A0AAE8SUU4_9PEZI|nr:related to campothecin resistance conferring protein [Cephalotrichum gorgonifer]
MPLPNHQWEQQSLASRSQLTIEDLNTSKGTFINGLSIQGQKHVVPSEKAEFTMGKCPDVFRITWVPVVLTYSFTSREMKNDPLNTLRADLEQLDIKFLTEYNVRATTHVVSKKRNTAKGLQALINGKYIVSGSFTDSIIASATVQEGDASPLEQDFDGAWPNELDHLPPRGSEATQSPASDYAPDPARQTIFTGFTFIFYDKAQWDNLLAPITNGQGKALLYEVVAHETQVNDFVRYVKSVAGEKGLGSFNDGGEGKGVVVVRYLPAKGDDVSWYADFTTAVSLQLDHRTIEQKEFLEAILVKDAKILRRPLPVDARPDVPTAQRSPDVDMADSAVSGAGISHEPSQSGSQNLLRRTRVRRPATKRFKGFDDDDDDVAVVQESTAASEPVIETVPEWSKQGTTEDDEGLFVSQGSAMASQDSPDRGQRATRKRTERPIPDEDEIMDDIAPAAAAAKRRRIARGEDPILREPTVEPTDQEVDAKPADKPKKIKKEIDVLEVARKTREEVEAKARAEQEDLDNLPADIDLAEIRRLAIVEEMPLRVPPGSRTREQDIADGRWDPRWNGRKNFKRFRQRGEVTGRPHNRVIVPLTQVKAKEFGIGDDYWLEDEEVPRRESQLSLSQASRASDSRVRQVQAPPRTTQSQLGRQASRRTVSDDSEDEDETAPISLGISELGQASLRTRSSRTSQRTGDAQMGSAPTRTSTQKRTATQASAEPPAKRVRQTMRAAVAAAESEDSDEEVGFRFGRRK